MPGAKDVFLAVILSIELLLGHHFGVAGVPDRYGGGIVGVFWLFFILYVFVLVFVLRGRVCLCSVTALLFLGFFWFRDFFFPFGHANKNCVAVFGPRGFVKRDGAHAGRKLCISGRVVGAGCFGSLAEMSPR